MSDFCVVIPAKNEGSIIAKVVADVIVLPNCKEVIVVDDGSDDNTAIAAGKAGARVISHPYSKGNGAAIKTGARAAQESLVVFMDGDGQHRAVDIPRLLDRLSEGFDLVVGARIKGCQASFGRKVANRLYNCLASFMTGNRIEDLTSGFRAVKREKFLEFINLLPNGFSYPTTSTMAFFRTGYSVDYVWVTADSRQGKSHIKPIQDGIRFMLIIFKIGTLYSPLKLFVPISLILFFIGSAYYGFTFFTMGRFTNMSALMFTTSLVVFLVGLVSEQITALMYSKSG
ncbi:glycosyltransferase family 2 protein [Marinobacter sp.]|uniref:glycosyltransferase family 2 protein n=1 Tax=Marinobacter sp. TaxID=50741 RepID=UPI002B271F75|nr:glycosyltransferase family 2 protein [Marinobacter sp.]